jgi:ornithine--oxo-acid transaminase
LATIAADFPNLVQMDVSPLAGILAERLLRYTPYLQKVFFTNSGAEAVESAMKFARTATGRPGFVYCTHVSLNGDRHFWDGFGPFLPHCSEIPFNDLAALERALSTREVIGAERRGVGMGSLYRSQHELLPLFKNGSPAHEHSRLARRGRWRSNV